MSEKTRNPVGWFEIPVTDSKRAVDFYSTVLGLKLEKVDFGNVEMHFFEYDPEKPGAAGALVKHEMYTPSPDGVVVYFTAHSGDLDNELAKVGPAGGKVLQPKTAIGEHGFYAFVLDTEGNRIAIHSMK